MGYQLLVVSPDDPDIALGVSIAFDRPGVFDSIRDSNNQALNNLKNLLLTRIGERYTSPTYGTNLLNIIFEPSNEERKQDVIDAITGPVNHWLPYITLINIDVITAEDDPNLDHQIIVTITFSSGYLEQTIGVSLDNDGGLGIV